jgi:ABC-2 type transport system ATP-binding protein
MEKVTGLSLQIQDLVLPPGKKMKQVLYKESLMESGLAIQTEALTKIYYPRTGDPVQALKDVSLAVPYGQVFGLLGPNGAGKTTLVRILATLLRATGGRAEACGYDVERDEQQVRRIIGYAGQDSERSAYFRLTVRENLLYFAHALRGVPIRTARERINEIAAGVGFTDQLDKEFTTLSGGQKQLVVVIRALLHQPKLVFLDEPSKSLDPVTADCVRTFLIDHAREHGMTILLTTHNMNEAEEICDRLAFINKGRLQFVGTPLEFRRSVTVQETVEVTVPDQDVVLERLRQLPGVNHATGNGTIRLYCQDGFSVLKEVVTALEEVGTKASVSMVEPSLEDAFSILVNNGWEVTND